MHSKACGKSYNRCRKHYPAGWRLFLPAFVMFLAFIPRGYASDIDLGLGFGLYHGEIHSGDPMPEDVVHETAFRTFMSFSAELGFRASDHLKVAIKPYYHSRNYTYETHFDDMFQLYGHYLDIPLSLIVNYKRTELFAGPGVGVLLGGSEVHDNGFDEPEGGWNDLKPVIPSLHLGIRLPANKSGSAALEVQYAHDIIPFSGLWGRHITQDRFAMHGSYRFLRVPKGQSILPDSLGLRLKGFHLGLGLGLHTQYIHRRGVYDYDTYPSFQRGGTYPLAELGTLISSRLGVSLSAATNARSYYIEDYQDYRELRFTARYIDLPLQLRINANGVEYSAGPSLAIRYGARYSLHMGGSGDLPAPEDVKDAAGLIPGYAVGIRVPFKRLSPWAFNMLYSHDLKPFSRLHGLDKSQSRIGFHLSYRFGDGIMPTDILPEDYEARYKPGSSSNIGLEASEVMGNPMYMPYFSLGTHRRLGAHWGWGDSWFWGFTVVGFEDESEGMTFLRGKYQLDLSWRAGPVELFLAPGVSMDAGLLSSSDPEALFPLFPYANLMLVREAGIRLDISPRVAVQVSCEAINSLVFNEFPALKIGVRFNR